MNGYTFKRFQPNRLYVFGGLKQYKNGNYGLYNEHDAWTLYNIPKKIGNQLKTFIGHESKLFDSFAIFVKTDAIGVPAYRVYELFYDNDTKRQRDPHKLGKCYSWLGNKGKLHYNDKYEVKEFTNDDYFIYCGNDSDSVIVPKYNREW